SGSSRGGGQVARASVNSVGVTGVVAASAMISRTRRRVAVSMQSGRIGGGSLRGHARRRFFAANWGSARLLMFSVLHSMPVKWGAAEYPCLIIPAKKLIRQLRSDWTALQRSRQTESLSR